jgi:tRNA threonylcarbamoyladenosine biosynthesis protein TsaE
MNTQAGCGQIGESFQRAAADGTIVDKNARWSIMIAIELASLADTEALGRRLGKHLFAGAVVALIGPLGAGKTTLVRAIAEGLDIADPRVVSSPTFVLIQEYDARLPIYHFDAYRLAGVGEFADLGAHEYLEGDGVCLIEWADRVPQAMPPERLEARLIIVGDSARRLELTAHGERYQRLLQLVCV